MQVVRRAVSSILAAATFAGGLSGMVYVLLWAESFAFRFLAGYSLFVTIGALWLWHDFVAGEREWPGEGGQ